MCELKEDDKTAVSAAKTALLLRDLARAYDIVEKHMKGGKAATAENISDFLSGVLWCETTATRILQQACIVDPGLEEIIPTLRAEMLKGEENEHE